ncbi:hypothetical protein HanXRQr2_Chr11g0494351 [Helianthus annuus]|uniref:Uncharacterized protein n=1 Tax=Helianthus annuus TaxID=4232 RepID=A0A9K3HPH5_HELAN|nr:hypothetical protein HanXRQr2_Chr11g0494351 [Helianthus annuus]KAJ0875426.1 hypothetical protein HanPSC8_Chr11g0476301 [Helianthus annuus]
MSLSFSLAPFLSILLLWGLLIIRKPILVEKIARTLCTEPYNRLGLRVG